MFIHRLARALVREGAEVKVVAPGGSRDPRSATLEGVHIDRFRYRLPVGTGLAEDPAGIVPTLRARPWLGLQLPGLVAALTFAAVRASSDADLLHAHWLYPAGLAGLVASRIRRLPLVVTAHGTDLRLASHHVAARWMTRVVAARAGLVLGVSRALCQELRALGAPQDRVRFAPLGVEVRSQGQSVPSEAPETRASSSAVLSAFARGPGVKVVFVGRLVPSKSVQTLVEACSILVAGGHAVTLGVVGAGPEERGLRRLALDAGLPCVHFAGRTAPRDVDSWLRAAEVFVLPSLEEGRGVVLLEAMAAGLPVVASDVPGPRELVEPGRTGSVFEAGSARSLAAALEPLIVDAKLRQRLGTAGRAMLRDRGLTSRASARRHVELYRQLLAQRRVACGPDDGEAGERP